MQLSAKRIQISDAKPDGSCLAAIGILPVTLAGRARATAPAERLNAIAEQVGRITRDYMQAARTLQTLLKSSVEKNSPGCEMKRYCDPTVEEILSTLQRMKDIMSETQPASTR